MKPQPSELDAAINTLTTSLHTAVDALGVVLREVGREQSPREGVAARRSTEGSALPPLLPPKEAARIMGCSVSTVQERAREGKIKRVGDGKGTRYVTASILDWIAREGS